jgi:peptidyl-prolyl cis-trans isomerase C
MDLSVHGVGLARERVWHEMQHHPAPTRDAAEREAAEALAVRELLAAEAARRGYLAAENAGSEAAVQAAIARLIDAAVPMTNPDEESCRAYHAGHADRFRSPDLYECAHILLPAPEGDATARAGAKAEAERLIAVLQRSPERFAELARAHSACSSAAEGGRLGQVARGETAPEFESFLAALEEGQLSPVPVPTRFGWHVLRLDRRAPGRPLPYEAVRDRIAAYLAERDWRRRVAAFIAGLAAAAEGR